MNTPLLQFPIITKLTKYFMCVIIYICQHGGIGRRTGLKIQRWQHRAGSTPAAGIMIKTRFLNLVFFIFYFFPYIEVTKNYLVNFLLNYLNR